MNHTIEITGESLLEVINKLFTFAVQFKGSEPDYLALSHYQRCRLGAELRLCGHTSDQVAGMVENFRGMKVIEFFWVPQDFVQVGYGKPH